MQPCRPMHQTTSNPVTKLQLPMPDIRIYSVPPDWLTYFEQLDYLLWVDGHKPRTFNGSTDAK